MVAVLIIGCGQILPGNGAVASFNGVHFKGELLLAVGLDSLAKLQ